MTTTGVVKEKVERVLRRRPYYKQFLTGTYSRRAFHQMLVQDEPRLLGQFGLTQDEVRFASRYPRSEDAKVDECLFKLYDAGLLPSYSYDKKEYQEYAALLTAKFDHGGLQTFIYPEEGRLVFALSSILKPQFSATLGSFYGWWAFWSLPAILKERGRMVLVDNNPKVCGIAEQNLRTLGFDGVCSVTCKDAIEFLDNKAKGFDFILLDAEGPSDAVDTSRRGKAVYGPISDALVPWMHQQSVLVCHNILFDQEAVTDAYLHERASQYRQDYQHFFAVLTDVFDTHIHLDTTEGVGVYGSASGRALISATCDTKI